MVPEPIRLPERGEEPSIPGYHIEAVIGRGATGTVYRARQVAVDRLVALKVLHPALAGQRRIVQRLQREARTTARLANPHVVSAIDMGETAGRWWYAMEYVDGPSLALVLRQEGRLEEREALRLFIPLCEALEHLCEHGVVHRDIKPANILIDRTVGARLADLGLAFADDDPALTAQGGTLGTPHYISPEQAVDPSQADVRSDIWSFGATLYHAVCGRPPFHGSSAAEVLSAVLYAKVPDPLRFAPSLSRGLVLVLRKCLTREPLDRYQTPREVLLDLERVRERRAPKVSQHGLDPVEREPRKWVKPLWTALAVAAGLGLVLLLSTQLGGDGAERGGGDDAAAPAALRHEQLESLARRAARAPARREPAVELLRELEQLRAQLPVEFYGRWRELSGGLEEQVRAQLGELFDASSAEVDLRIKAGDFVGARGMLEETLPQELVAGTGFTLDELERRFSLVSRRRAELARGLDEAQDLLTAELGKRLGQRRDELLAEAELARERGAFRTALELLAVDDRTLLSQVGYGGYRFPEEVLSALLRDVRTDLAVGRQGVVFAWNELDRELGDWIDGRAERLREGLELSGIGPTPAADELRHAFDNELFERNLDRAEMPVNSTRIALERLERRGDSLAAYEDGLRRDRLRGGFEVNRRLEQSRWERRDYLAVRSLWTEFEARLLEEPGDPEQPWRTEILRRTRVRVREAELLQGLLEDAAAGVLAADGTWREMRVFSAGIAEEGRIAAGVDPLRDGFELVPDHGSAHRLDLRTLAAVDLLALAGVPMIDADMTPEQRVTVAAFRFHEGALGRAEATLGSGDPPEQEPDLAADLGTRIADALALAEETAAERAAEVKQLLDWANDDAMRDYPDRALMAIDRLLTEFPDVSPVPLLRAGLERKRRSLENRARTFEESYAPHRIEQLRAGRVRLGFDFGSPQAGAWEKRFWEYDGVGWSASRTVKDDDELAREWGARLILGSPLDRTREIDFTLSFELMDTNAPPQLLMVSLVGFHAAVVGPGLAGSEGRSRWRIATGDLGEFVKEILEGQGEETPALLQPGEEQKLRLVVHARRGTVRLELDGKLVAERRFPGRQAEPPSLVLRSWDPVRVHRAELEVNRF